MKKLCAMLLLLLFVGCDNATPPATTTPAPVNKRVTVYDGEGTARLSNEFAKQFEVLVAGEGKPLSDLPKPLSGKPNGSFTLPDRTSFEFYGNFVVADSKFWHSPILEQFWEFLGEKGESMTIQFKPEASKIPRYAEPTQMGH